MRDRMHEISYKEASRLLFVHSERRNTHTFLGMVGACWPTDKLRKLMRQSTLFFHRTGHWCGGHHVIMITPEDKTYWLETSGQKMTKYLKERT